MLLFYIIFGDRNPPYPACNAGGLRRVFFVNRHGGTLRRAGWVAFTKVTDIAFTSDFCNNHSHPASPTSLYLTSPRPRPTRPRVPYLMSSSSLSRVPASHTWCAKSPHTRPDVPVPLLYTAIFSPTSYPSNEWNVRHFLFSRPKQLNLVPRSSRLTVPYPARTLHFWRHFLVKHKILSNLVISNWLWWIMLVLLANQNRGNILNEW